MKMSSRFSGTVLLPLTTKIDWRQTTNYAAAVGDNNPLFLDDIAHKKLFAHPLFPVAITWRIAGKLWEFVDNKDFPMHLLATQVHYREHLYLHKPLHSPSTLRLEGKIAGILPHPSGTLSIVAFTAYGSQKEPIFTEYITGLLRGVVCEDQGTVEKDVPAEVIEPPSLSVENYIAEMPISISPMDPYIYDGCTDIVFPIHTSPAFAKNMGLPHIIYQGTATLAKSVSLLTHTYLQGEANRIEKIIASFRGMVFPGDTITLAVKSNSPNEICFDVLNKEGKPAIKDGTIHFSNEHPME